MYRPTADPYEPTPNMFQNETFLELCSTEKGIWGSCDRNLNQKCQARTLPTTPENHQIIKGGVTDGLFIYDNYLSGDRRKNTDTDGIQFILPEFTLILAIIFITFYYIYRFI